MGVGSSFQGKAGTKQGRVCDVGKSGIPVEGAAPAEVRRGERKGERASRWGWNLGVSQEGMGGCRAMGGF